MYVNGLTYACIDSPKSILLLSIYIISIKRVRIRLSLIGKARQTERTSIDTCDIDMPYIDIRFV